MDCIRADRLGDDLQQFFFDVRVDINFSLDLMPFNKWSQLFLLQTSNKMLGITASFWRCRLLLRYSCNEFNRSALGSFYSPYLVINVLQRHIYWAILIFALWHGAKWLWDYITPKYV